MDTIWQFSKFRAVNQHNNLQISLFCQDCQVQTLFQQLKDGLSQSLPVQFLTFPAAVLTTSLSPANMTNYPQTHGFTACPLTFMDATANTGTVGYTPGMVKKLGHTKNTQLCMYGKSIEWNNTCITCYKYLLFTYIQCTICQNTVVLDIS